MPGIVVGVDGSDQSRRALEWAIGEAALHAAPLEVVAVHQVAVDAWVLAPMRLPTDEKEREQVHAGAQHRLNAPIAQTGARSTVDA